MALSNELAKQPGTDEWWIIRLSKALGARLPRIHELEDWMDGNPPIANPDVKNEGFERLRKIARLNLAEMIINAMLYRMSPMAFRTASKQDDTGDENARKIWKRNNMKLTATETIEWMLSMSVSYMIVGKDEKGKALITSEHPEQVITEEDPSQGHTIAGLKIYRDDLTNSDIAVLYCTDGRVRTARHEGKSSFLPKRGQKDWMMRAGAWTWDEVTEQSPTGKPPIFKFENRNAKGEFEKHLDTLERINHTILQRMIIIAFQAFRQRGVKGVPNTDKETGKEIDYTDIFKSDPGAVWILPATAEFWESGQTSIEPVLQAVKDDIQNLAVASSTPMFVAFPDSSNGSAEGANVQRENLIFKIEDAINRIDGKLAAVMSSSFHIEGMEELAQLEEIEVIWASPRRSTLAERAASAQLAIAAGLPWRMTMQKFMELTLDEIKVAEAERDEEMFKMAAMGLLAPPGQPGQSPGTNQPGGVGGVPGFAGQPSNRTTPQALKRSGNVPGPK